MKQLSLIFNSVISNQQKELISFGNKEGSAKKYNPILSKSYSFLEIPNPNLSFNAKLYRCVIKRMLDFKEIIAFHSCH